MRLVRTPASSSLARIARHRAGGRPLCLAADGRDGLVDLDCGQMFIEAQIHDTAAHGNG